jgi:hypothetical protein
MNLYDTFCVFGTIEFDLFSQNRDNKPQSSRFLHTQAVMSETKRSAIRWIMCIAYAMFAFGGDSLHWIPGNTCCRTSHSHVQDSHDDDHCSHGHHHDHVHEPSLPESGWQGVDHVLIVTEGHTCPICQNLNNASAIAANASLFSNCLIQNTHSIDYVSIFDANLPRHSAPRGPPQIS